MKSKVIILGLIGALMLLLYGFGGEDMFSVATESGEEDYLIRYDEPPRRIAIRLSDDSPEDGEGGALLYSERIFIDGVQHPEIHPLIEGGIRHRGLLEASGTDVVTLTYDIEHDFRPGLEDKITEFREIHRIEVELVLGNDYRVEVKSDARPEWIGVVNALGNVKDFSNQAVIRFGYLIASARESASEPDSALGKGITYEFDEVEVLYAAEFTALPDTVEHDNWVAVLAGGPDRPITALYGVVQLKLQGEVMVQEEFLKVSGDTESKRFLVNAGYYDYHDTTGTIRQSSSFFWSAKKLVENVVEKDFTLPIHAITVVRTFDLQKQLTGFILAASNEGGQALQDFGTKDPTSNLYHADLTSVRHVGDPKAGTF